MEELAIALFSGGLVEARIHVKDADGVVEGGGHGFASSGGAAPKANDGDAEYAAEVEAVEGIVEATGPISERIEVEAEEFLAFLEGALDEGSGDGEVFGRKGAPGLVAADGDCESFCRRSARFEDEKAALHVGDGEGGFDDSGEDVFGGEGVLKAAGDFGEGAELGEFAGALGASGGAGETAEELANFGFVFLGEDEAVAVFETEVDGVAGIQFCLIYFGSVESDAVEAFEVFDEDAVGGGDDLRVATRNAAIAEDELVIRLAADGEGRGVEGYPGGVAGRIDDGEFQGQRTIVGESALLCGGGFFFLVFATGLAVGAVAADFRAHDGDGEAEGVFDFLAHFGEGLAEILFDFAAIEANDVRVLALHLGFVVVLVAVFV